MKNEVNQFGMSFATEAELRAFEAGKALGLREGKDTWTQNGKFLATLSCLQTLIRKQQITAEEAMALLDLPKKERKTYGKILANRAKQKQDKSRP